MFLVILDFVEPGLITKKKGGGGGRKDGSHTDVESKLGQGLQQ